MVVMDAKLVVPRERVQPRQVATLSGEAPVDVEAEASQQSDPILRLLAVHVMVTRLPRERMGEEEQLGTVECGYKVRDVGLLDVLDELAAPAQIVDLVQA